MVICMLNDFLKIKEKHYIIYNFYITPKTMKQCLNKNTFFTIKTSTTYPDLSLNCGHTKMKKYHKLQGNYFHLLIYIYLHILKGVCFFIPKALSYISN